MAGWKDMDTGTRSAVVAIVVILLGLGGYQFAGRGVPQAEVPKPEAAPSTAATPEAVAPQAGASEGSAAQAPAPDAAPQAEPSKADAPVADAAPSPPGRFDVVRVEPDGQTLVAGQAAPGAKISIRLDGAEVATAEADAEGRFVAQFGLEPGGQGRLMTMSATLPDGSQIALAGAVAIAQTGSAQTGSAQTGSAQTAQAAPAAPGAPPEAATTLALTPEGAQVLQAPEAGLAGTVTLETIAYPSGDVVQFGGRGAPGALVQVYLDNAPLGEPVPIGPQGSWNLTVNGIEPGVHLLRVDEMDASGKVTSRFETPFKRETVEALAAASAAANAATSDPGAETGPASEPAAPATDLAASDLADGVPSDPAPSDLAPSDLAPSDLAPSDPAPSAPAPAESATMSPAPEPQSAEPKAEAAEAPAQSAEPPSGQANPGALVAGLTQDLDPLPGSQDPAAPPADPAAQPSDTANATASADPSPAPSDPAKLTEPSPAPQAPDAGGLVTITVQPGFTLWGIAQSQLGEGVLYVEVYAANKDRIRNPDLIYPGQIFYIPKP